ncbi:MAG: type II toxin-antitoxin system VapC family toxin [Acidobacteriota bacterium]
MIGLDTNVLVRYLVEDDPGQSPRAVALIERAVESGERFYVSEIVLCEVVWVLSSAYGYSRERIATALGGVLRARQLVIENPEAARRSLDRYAEGSADFADYLILDHCRTNGCDRVASFDGGLKSEETVFIP